MAEAGINPNQSITYNNLSQEQKDALTLSQIKRESGGLYKVLTQTPKTETQAKEYTATDSALFDKFLSGKNTSDDTKTLRRLGYTLDDVNSYAKNKPKTTSLSDDQRTLYNSQLNSFRGNQIVKDYEQQIGQVANIVSSLNSNS